MRILAILTGIVVCLSAAPAQSASFECREALSPDQKLLTDVEKRYRDVSDLSAQFFQQSLFIGLDKSEASRGEVHFKKPGMMDWNYAEPDKQRFISDAKTVWFYQPELNQVTITDFTNTFESDLPVTFLIGIGSLHESFDLQKACKGDEGIILELQPKRSEGTLSNFFLLVRADDYSPVGARTLDVGGNETTIMLVNPKYNEKLSDHQFRFEIPRGSDIIDQRQAK